MGIVFLQMVLETANDATDSINALENLHKKNIALLETVPSRTRDNALKLFEYVEKKAIIDTSKILKLYKSEFVINFCISPTNRAILMP